MREAERYCFHFDATASAGVTVVKWYVMNKITIIQIYNGE
jgi:hypothetical protein